MASGPPIDAASNTTYFHGLILPIDHSVVCDSNGRVILQRKPWQGSYKPPISEVMRNCSEAFGNNLITIVFSGMGNDGSDVAATVKKMAALFGRNPLTVAPARASHKA